MNWQCVSGTIANLFSFIIWRLFAPRSRSNDKRRVLNAEIKFAWHYAQHQTTTNIKQRRENFFNEIPIEQLELPSRLFVDVVAFNIFFMFSTMFHRYAICGFSDFIANLANQSSLCSHHSSYNVLTRKPQTLRLFTSEILDARINGWM